MKRNKLLKKVLTLGLTAAVAVTSMGPTLSMLNPVVAYAEDEGGEQAQTVTIVEVKEPEIRENLSSVDSDAGVPVWTANAEKIDYVNSSLEGNKGTITVGAKLGEMEKIPEGSAGDTGKRAFPIVVKLSSKVEKSYGIGESNAAQECTERVNDAWKCLGECYATDEEANNWEGKGQYCIVWLSERYIGEGRKIFFGSDENKSEYTVIVEDTTEYDITASVTNATVGYKKDGNAANPAKAKVGEEYTITLTAEGGYCFDVTNANKLTNDGWEATVGKENLEYSTSYSVGLEAEDYENLSDKKINPIPNGVTATERTKEDTLTTSNVYMNYISSNDEIVGLKFVQGGKYIINDGDATEYSANQVVSVNESDIGKTYTIKKAASDNTKLDSDALEITIKRAPKIPNTVKGEKAESADENAKGKITGVTADMEYAVSLDGEEWVAGTGSDEEVTPGAYYVRYKANNTDGSAGFTGEATKIIVGAYGSTVIDLRASVDPTVQEKNYGVALKNFTVTVTNAQDVLSTDNTAVISLEDANNGFKSLETTTLSAISAGSNTTITVKPAENLNVGTYRATLRIMYNDGSSDSNNAETSVNFELKINRAKWDAPTGTVSASSIQAGTINFPMDGSITAPNGGSLEYGYALDNSAPTNTNDAPGFTNVPAGEYYVFVRVKEDDNHTASDWHVSSEKVTVVAPSTPSNPGGTTPSNPGSGSGSSGGSSSSGSSGGSSGGGTGAAGTTPTPSTPTVTTTPDGTVVATNKDGAYVDKNGNVAANTVVKESTGVMHVTDSTGHIAKDDVVTTADGTTYVVGAEGNVVVSDIAEIKGNKYVADENGELVTNAFSTIGGEKYYSDAEGLVKTDGFFNAAGKKYYADEDGAVAVKKLVTVDGKKYFATKTGAIATKKIVTTGGKKYFATKTGAIASNKVVTTGGKKYFATKNGTLATNKWVKAGNKKYFCNKKGVITKTKKIKK